MTHKEIFTSMCHNLEVLSPWMWTNTYKAPVTSQMIKDKQHDTKLINEFSVMHQSTISLTLQPNCRCVHQDGGTPITLFITIII
jgi:hypothetical protein